MLGNTPCLENSGNGKFWDCLERWIVEKRKEREGKKRGSFKPISKFKEQRGEFKKKKQIHGERLHLETEQ